MGVVRGVDRDDVTPVRMMGGGQPHVQGFINLPLCDVNADDSITKPDVVSEDDCAWRTLEHCWGDALFIKVGVVLAVPGA